MVHKFEAGLLQNGLQMRLLAKHAQEIVRRALPVDVLLQDIVPAAGFGLAAGLHVQQATATQMYAHAVLAAAPVQHVHDLAALEDLGALAVVLAVRQHAVVEREVALLPRLEPQTALHEVAVQHGHDARDSELSPEPETSGWRVKLKSPRRSTNSTRQEWFRNGNAGFKWLVPTL